MRYLTKNWYLECQKPAFDMNRINAAAAALNKAEKNDHIPEPLKRGLCFHDGKVISETTAVSKAAPAFSGRDYILSIDCPMNPHSVVTFHDALVKSERSPEGSNWLYEEIYRHKSGNGYEIHILFESCSGRSGPTRPTDLIEMKIICQDITFE